MYKRTRWHLIVWTSFVALCVYALAKMHIQLGIDLQGGTELTYALDLSRIETNRSQVATEVKDIIAKRLNAYGLKEISVSVQGQDRLVIQVPGTDSETVSRLKRQIATAGNLTFRLVAGDEYQNPERWAQYEKEEREYIARDQEWVRRKLEDPTYSEERPRPPDYIVRYEVEKKTVGNREEYVPKPGGKLTLENFHREYNRATNQWEPQGIISGRYLSRVGETIDTTTYKPAVSFEFRGEGATQFGELTGANIKRRLAIVLDDNIMQAPQIKDKITERGQITGNFTSDYVRDTVTILRGGSLPTKPRLISESTVGSLLGQDSIESGIRAVIIGTAGVMIVMAIYYGVGGMVANVALALNVLAIFAFMAAFMQTLTMPGLAGVLLTIGMAVDANILIFERYREERKRGKPLVPSLVAGYDRAFWVIFDSNLTTIITAYVLFYLGTPEIKGFAVTLISGLFASFFTSVFATRMILSLLINLGILKEMRFMEAFKTPRVPFVRYQKASIGVSVVLIVLMWALVLWRGSDNYGIDFTGGARVTMHLVKDVPVDVMRAKVGELMNAQPELFGDWSLQTIQARPPVKSAFVLLTRPKKSAMKTASAEELPPAPSPAAAESPAAVPPTPPSPAPGETAATETAPKAGGEGAPAPAAKDVVPPAQPAPAGGAPAPVPPAAMPKAAPAAPAGEAAQDEEAAQLVRGALEKLLAENGWLIPGPFPLTRWSPDTTPGAPPGSEFVEVDVNLLKMEGTTMDQLKADLNAMLEKSPLFSRGNRDVTASYKGVEVTSVEIVGKPTDDLPVTRLRVKTSSYPTPLPGQGDRSVPSTQQTEEEIRDFFRDTSRQDKLQLSEPFPQVLTVGPRVASSLQADALVALFISFLGIIFYLALRFEFIYGLAGVLALVHDSMVAIGAMAVADYFIPDFTVKFNLTELAAILTIVGYSINDTIVLFDRIRENLTLLAKRKYGLEQIIDISVNQTLSRTIWTSLTVLLVTLMLLGFGGETVRGFAYILAAGLVSGTYSSVFIAAPIVLWLHNRALARKRALAGVTS